MAIWWIGNVVLVAVIFPVVIVLLKGVLDAATSIVPKIDAIASVGTAASKDLDAVVVLLTTQSYINTTVATVADYGGSLDVLLPNAQGV